MTALKWDLIQNNDKIALQLSGELSRNTLLPLWQQRASFLSEKLANQSIIEFDLTNKKFSKQLEKAAQVAKYAFILGEDEILKHQVSIKNLELGKQITVDRTNCLKMIDL